MVRLCLCFTQSPLPKSIAKSGMVPGRPVFEQALALVDSASSPAIRNLRPVLPGNFQENLHGTGNFILLQSGILKENCGFMRFFIQEM